MSFQKLIIVVCLLALFAVGNQKIHRSDSDSDITVTHPSVFHDEYIDTKSTIKGFDNELRQSKGPKSLDKEDQGRSFFEGLSDTSSDTSESSDATDASETSDRDVRGDVFDNISRKAKEFEGKAFSKIDKHRRLAKLQARKYWEALKFKILREANAVGLSLDELKGKLQSSKRDAKEAWKSKDRSFFEGLSDTSSDTSESSDATDASESDSRRDAFQRARGFEERAFRKFKEQKKLAKVEAKKYREALKSKIISEAGSTGISQEELRQKLKNAKKDFKEAWKFPDCPSKRFRDFTDASESSDSDNKGEAFQKAREFKRNAQLKIEEQKRLAKLEAKKYWKALKSKISNEGNAAGLSQEELKEKLKNTKREFKQSWRFPDCPSRRFRDSRRDSTDSETSDSDARENVFNNISRKAKEFEGEAFRKFGEQRRVAKLQARKYWENLKLNILREGNALRLSEEELKGQLQSGRRNAKQFWDDLKWKIRNGNDILSELLDNTDQLNPDQYAKRGSTEPINNTAL